LHNLGFFMWLVKEARTRITDGTFGEWKKKMVIKLSTRL
jgi:queuine tRNA-ribosyltransferase